MIESVKERFDLSDDQTLCYLFMANRLKSILKGEGKYTDDHTADRFLFMTGAGGSGKSRVIRAITDLLAKLDCSPRLNVTATTGIAANSIQGSTIDSLCHLSRKGGRIKFGKQRDEEDEEHDRRAGNIFETRWISCQFLIIDEVNCGIEGMLTSRYQCLELRSCIKCLKHLGKSKDLHFHLEG